MALGFGLAQLNTGPDLGENIDELLMSLSYNGIQLSCGSWKTLRPRKKKLRDGASQDGDDDEAENEAPGSLAGESKDEAPWHQSYEKPKASSTPSTENPLTRRAKALLGIGDGEDPDSLEKDIYFFCHRSGNPGKLVQLNRDF